MCKESVLAMAALLVGAGCSFNETGIGDEDGGGPGPTDARSAVDAEPPDAEPVPTAFEKPITIHGGQVTGTLEDFPVYIELIDPDLEARATAAGDDIFFVDAQANALDHEIQHWDADTGRLEAWVRIPELEQGSDVEIWLRYGEPDGVPAPDPAGVWQAGFVAVFHLEQEPEGGTDAIIDSVGGHHGTASQALEDDRLITATLGRGLRFEGGDEEITFSNPLTGASPHTVSAWVDQNATNSNDALVVLGTGACGQARWFHTRYTGGAVAAGFYCDDITGGPDIQDEGPTLLHWTYDDADESRIYRDGVLVLGPTEHSGTQSTIGGTGRIGNAPAEFGQNLGLDAVVDEVRIATVARSVDWIATEFVNQSAPDDFYSIGDERPVP